MIEKLIPFSFECEIDSHNGLSYFIAVNIIFYFSIFAHKGCAEMVTFLLKLFFRFFPLFSVLK